MDRDMYVTSDLISELYLQATRRISDAYVSPFARELRSKEKARRRRSKKEALRIQAGECPFVASTWTFFRNFVLFRFVKSFVLLIPRGLWLFLNIPIG